MCKIKLNTNENKKQKKNTHTKITTKNTKKQKEHLKNKSKSKFKKAPNLEIIIWKKTLKKTWTKKCFLEWKTIISNEIELFGMKLKYFELKLIKRNVPGVSLWGMSLSIEKTINVYQLVEFL